MLAAAGLAYVAAGLPDTRGLWLAPAGRAILVLDATGHTLATRGAAHGNDVPLAQMSRYLPLAVLAAEDRRFYAHWGVDVAGLARALFTNMQEGRIVQGGSTITQQLAKNVFLSPERTLKRKIQEALLAVWLEWSFTKDEILTLYLNRVYLGAGTYGVEAAARRYFDKSTATLTLPEAAMIAGLLKAPSRFAPTNDPDAAWQRASLILNTMVEAGFISPERRAQIDRRQLRYATGARTQGAQYFVDYVLDALPALVDPREKDLVVETTLHLPFQRRAEQAVEGVLAKKGEAAKAEEAALIAIDRTGAIRAMVGGRSFTLSQFNRATQAHRQPGSAFKPFVYLTAIEGGRTPQWRVLDAPLSLAGWSPTNFEASYRGEVTLQTALALSLNTAAVRVAQRVGYRNIVETAHRLGIVSSLDPVPSLALGTAEVSLLELTRAYVPFATGGRAPALMAIRRITARNGRVLYEAESAPAPHVVSPYDAGAMNAMLSAAVEWGTGRAARLEGRAVAGKTGTSQDFRDAWFIGYTADLVTGVWVGNDDAKPMAHVTGGALPAEVWHEFMTAAASVYPARPLPAGGYEPVPEAPTVTASAAPPESEKGAKEPTTFLSLFQRLGSLFSGSEEKGRTGEPRRDHARSSPTDGKSPKSPHP